MVIISKNLAEKEALNQQGSSMSHQEEIVETCWNKRLNVDLMQNFDP